jgi:signal transduction histidine kinase
LGIVLVAPFLLSWWMRPTVKWRAWRLVEYLALLAAISTVSYLTFARAVAPDEPYHELAYSTYPFFIWAAFRFEQREVVTSLLIVAVVAIWGTAHDLGPFTQGTLDARLIALDTFAAVTVVTALLLGAMTAERRRSQERLRRTRNELERRVKLRTADLERANKELYDLSYSMSHDLRAPLRAVNSFSELLTAKYAGVIDAEATRYLSIIAKNSRNMGQMIEDYLRLFRLRDAPLTITTLDNNILVSEIIEELFAAHPESKVHFNIQPLPLADGDTGLVRQVWINLLDNAVKFSRARAQPIVEVGGYTNGGHCVYYVKDNGVGFDMQWAPQLFKVFQRLHSNEFEGLGIGLAIAARIVQRHGGTIQAQGDADQGATFSFSLPREGSRQVSTDHGHSQSGNHGVTHCDTETTASR